MAGGGGAAAAAVAVAAAGMARVTRVRGRMAKWCVEEEDGDEEERAEVGLEVELGWRVMVVALPVRLTGWTGLEKVHMLKEDQPGECEGFLWTKGVGYELVRWMRLTAG